MALPIYTGQDSALGLDGEEVGAGLGEAPSSPAARVEEGLWVMDPAVSPGPRLHPALGSTVLLEP